MAITMESAWDIATVIAAAEPLARARGLGASVFIEHRSAGPRSDPDSVVHIDFKQVGVVTCWLEIDVEDLEACADRAAVTALVEQDVARVLQLRHGRRPA